MNDYLDAHDGGNWMDECVRRVRDTFFIIVSIACIPIILVLYTLGYVSSLLVGSFVAGWRVDPPEL